MNNMENFKDDPLKYYINPEVSEKAPEGFTSRSNDTDSGW